MAKQSYPVLGRLLRNGKLYDPGAKPGVTIDLDDDEVEEIPAHILGEPKAAGVKVAGAGGKQSGPKPAES